MEKLNQTVPKERLRRNLSAIQQRMHEALAKAGRALDSVRLVAVTKYAGAEEIQALHEFGVRDFGESRIQDAERKVKAIPSADIQWHLIGHLQTNKADKAVKIFQTVHSVDSLRVAEALNKEAQKRSPKPLRCLLEVNVAGEANKYGLPPDSAQISELLKRSAELKSLDIVGLMAMAPYAENPEPTSRPVFTKLRELLERANQSRCYPRPLAELSMGMTQDYQIAIEEGATLVRVGSALFE